MGFKGLIALGAATIALLAGPGVAWAQDDGTAGAATPVQADPAVAPDPATTSETDTPSTDVPASTDTESSVAEEPSSEATAEPAPAEPATAASVEASADQPQAEVETSTRAVTEVKKAKSAADEGCGLASTASVSPRRVGPPGPGCTRVNGGDISTDSNNPTVLPAINGVTVAIWIEDTPQGEVVHWQIVSGTFSGTDAIDLKVKGGPDPNGFTCQITNATPTGVCHAPVNPNNGKFYGVSHVDVCPGSTTNPPENPPPGGGGGGGVAGQTQKGGEKQGAKGAEKGGESPSVAEAAAAPVPGEELPFTGLQALWLLLIGGLLFGTGATVRTRLD